MKFIDTIVSDEQHPCLVCKEFTSYIEINFETYLHPGSCNDTLTKQYFSSLI